MNEAISAVIASWTDCEKRAALALLARDALEKEGPGPLPLRDEKGAVGFLLTCTGEPIRLSEADRQAYLDELNRRAANREAAISSEEFFLTLRNGSECSGS